MKISLIKCTSMLTVACVLSACGGGADQSPIEPEVAPLTNLSFMVDGITSENLEHADHLTWDLDNFTVNDDIDGDVNNQLIIDAMITAEETKL